MNALTQADRTISALEALLAEENAMVESDFNLEAHRQLTTSKLALAEELTAALEDVKAAGRADLQAVAAEDRDRLSARLVSLQDSMSNNADMLRRRGELARGLLRAVEAEARARSGTPLQTYGKPVGTPRPAALAVDSRA